MSRNAVSVLFQLMIFAASGSPLALGATAAPSATLGKETRYVPKKSTYEKLPAAKKGGTLFDNLSNNPKVMNPILSDDANSASIEPYLWARLFTEDAETLQPIPYLADTYVVSPDRKTYTFTLNKNARWEDGTPVTTADVKFTFDTQMNPKVEAAALRAYWEGTKLEIVDTHQFKFIVETPKFDTLRSLYLFQAIQAKQFAGESDFNRAKGILQPIGNGPYKLKVFSRDQKVELERVKDWWGSALPAFKNRHNADLIVLRIVTDGNLSYERFLRGEQDVLTFGSNLYETYATKVRGTDQARIGKSPKDGKTVWTGEFKNKAPRGYSYIAWNLKRPVFQSKKTRQALARIIDYAQIVDKVMYGFAYQSTSPFGSLTMNSDPGLRKSGQMLTFDRKKAIELLREDGWADTDRDNILDKTIDGKKVPFKFTLRFNSNNPSRGKIAQIVKENFKAAGIEVEIRSMEWNAFLADVDNRNYDAVILAWTATPYPNPKQTWHTDAEKNQGSNFVYYSNKEVDALIEKANLEFDLAKRSKILHQINRLIYEDQPYAFLVEPSAMIAGFNKKIQAPGGMWSMAYDVEPATDIYTFSE